MYNSMTVYFFDKSSMDYDANKNIFAFTGKFANEFVNHCIKHNILDTDARFFELKEFKLRFELDLNINLFNTTLKNESKFSCDTCNDSGTFTDGYDNYPCKRCENNRLIENF